MKQNILIIAYHYMPLITAGSFRMHAWSKYLPAFGWQPFILTRHWTHNSINHSNHTKSTAAKDIDREIGCAVVRTPYKQSFPGSCSLRNRLSRKEDPSKLEILTRKSLSFTLRNFLMLPDEQRGWFRQAFEAALPIIEDNNIRVILSTGAPWTAFKLGASLSKRTGIPWVADYRDPWTQRTTLGIKKEYAIWWAFSRPYERRITQSASALVHISEPLRNYLSKMLKRKVHLIPNGYDPEKFESARQFTPDQDTFTISFIGTLHSGTNTRVFLEGFQKFVDATSISPQGCRIDFIGDTTGHKRIQTEYRQFNKIAHYVSFNPAMVQDVAIKKMCQSHMLLSFPLDMEGCCPAKTYEYLASGRPILVTPDGFHRGVIKDLLNKTKGGAVLNTPIQVAEYLEKKLSEFRVTRAVISTTDQTVVEQYSRKRQVKKLASILDSIGNQ